LAAIRGVPEPCRSSVSGFFPFSVPKWKDRLDQNALHDLTRTHIKTTLDNYTMTAERAARGVYHGPVDESWVSLIVSNQRLQDTTIFRVEYNVLAPSDVDISNTSLQEFTVAFGSASFIDELSVAVSAMPNQLTSFSTSQSMDGPVYTYDTSRWESTTQPLDFFVTDPADAQTLTRKRIASSAQMAFMHALLPVFVLVIQA